MIVVSNRTYSEADILLTGQLETQRDTQRTGTKPLLGDSL
jgi:hypothetical protein